MVFLLLQNTTIRMKKNIGMVLSGGGTKCIAQAGVLQYLEEIKVRPEIFACTSAGAIVAGLYAFGKKPEEILDFFKSVYFFRWNHFTLTKPGIINSEVFASYLLPIVGDVKIKELPIELLITATDLIRGETYVFKGEDRLTDAIIASCAVPGVASPYAKEDMLLSDGGILNNFPSDLLAESCRKLIGVYVSPLEDVRNRQLNSIKSIATRAFELLSHRVEKQKFEQCEWFISPHELSTYGMFETKVERMEALFRLGYESAKESQPKDFDRFSDSFFSFSL